MVVVSALLLILAGSGEGRRQLVAVLQCGEPGSETTSHGFVQYLSSIKVGEPLRAVSAVERSLKQHEVYMAIG